VVRWYTVLMYYQHNAIELHRSKVTTSLAPHRQFRVAFSAPGNFSIRLKPSFMEITITWTKLLIFFVSYFMLRYLYHTYMKIVTGSTDAFNPTVPYDAALAAKWDRENNWWELRREQEKSARLEAELKLMAIKLQIIAGDRENNTRATTRTQKRRSTASK